MAVKQSSTHFNETQIKFIFRTEFVRNTKRKTKEPPWILFPLAEKTHTLSENG
jgi:hypothetical protein